MPKAYRSFRDNVWQLIFAPVIALALLISLSLVSFCLYELAKYVDMRGTSVTKKTGQLLYTPIKNNDFTLAQALLEGSLEDPYIRAVHVHLTTENRDFHAGPEFFATTDEGVRPNGNYPTRRETRRSILFSSPIVNKNGTDSLGWIELELLSSPYSVIHYQTILITLCITLIGFLVAGYLAQRLFRNITDPLNHFKEIIDLLACGQLDARANPQKSREFIHLADSINAMAKSMSHAQQELQNHIQQSTQDLIETLESIEIKNVELDIARKEAIEASRIKSEFLANTSHEIRTPLNGILGFVGLALKTDIDEQQAQYLNTIRDSAQTLLTVINGILDFSKIESGKLTLDYAPLPLRQTIDETIHTLSPEAHEKHLQLISLIDKDIPSQLLGDSLRFKQVLSNLISNAIKFSEHGNITIRVKAIAQQETHLMLKVAVSDQGKGLSADQQADLFKPFTQSDSATNREQGGTGLGLAICKGLVERMNGEIGVESQPDEGSTFWFTARLGVDKKSEFSNQKPNLSQYNALLCSADENSLNQLQYLVRQWNMQEDCITEIHDIFPSVRQAHKTLPYQILIIDIHPNERRIQPVLLNNIAEQLNDEFNCKLVVCCTVAQQRTLQSNGNNLKTTFVIKPTSYEKLLKALDDALNINLTTLSITQAEELHSPSELTHVLLVDDNPANLQLASELLRGINTQVTQASSGLQAIEACQQQTFDIIFMDIQMPGMDGFEATKRIRELEKEGRRTPIIALTAHSLTEQKGQLLIAGMDDCISKPVSESQLAHIINRWAVLAGNRELALIKPTATQQLLSLAANGADTNGSVDINLSLKLANNKPLLARDMLDMLLKGLPSEQRLINTAFEENNMNQLAELIHRLYGSSCYCGVPRLKHISGLLDKLMQAQQYDEAKSALIGLNHAIDDVLTWGADRNLDEVFLIEQEA